MYVLRICHLCDTVSHWVLFVEHSSESLWHMIRNVGVLSSQSYCTFFCFFISSQCPEEWLFLSFYKFYVVAEGLTKGFLFTHVSFWWRKSFFMLRYGKDEAWSAGKVEIVPRWEWVINLSWTISEVGSRKAKSTVRKSQWKSQNLRNSHLKKGKV